MKKITDLLEKLSAQLIKKHVIPAFTCASDGWRELQIAQEYNRCTVAVFKNYITENEAQQAALSKAQAWCLGAASSHPANFIFAGNPGTGKNHLAVIAAKCNQLFTSNFNYSICNALTIPSHPVPFYPR